MNAYHSISCSAAPVHDANGNMTSGPVNGSAASGMVYGKENNNLLQVVSGHTSDYVYDAMGRLVQLTRHDVGAGQSATEILTWAGWTLITREIFTGNAVTETFRYTWGKDLSGSLEGVGGVGGMLAVERNVAGSNTWDIRYTHADANGNIIALTNSSGVVSARYRYDAFGKVLSATDVDASGWVNHNIHGFSSKPRFGNQGLLYYGYRWYSSTLGRWINRDPIEERGGRNLYRLLGNDCVLYYDILGLDWRDTIGCISPFTFIGKIYYDIRICCIESKGREADYEMVSRGAPGGEENLDNSTESAATDLANDGSSIPGTVTSGGTPPVGSTLVETGAMLTVSGIINLEGQMDSEVEENAEENNNKD